MKQALSRRLYIAAWLLLGTVSLGYFFALFQNSFTSTATDVVATSQGAGTLESRAPRITDTSDPGVAQALAHMRTEIDRLRASLDKAAKEKAALEAHIRELETAYGPSTASLPPQSGKPRADDVMTGTNGTGGARSFPRPKVDMTFLPMPVDGFAEVIPESPLPIAGHDKPRRTQFAVEIAAGIRSKDLSPRWKRILGRHGALVEGLSPHAVPMASAHGGKRFSLIAGPFRNAADAAVLCARLSAAGTRCKETVFAGEPLNKLAAR